MYDEEGTGRVTEEMFKKGLDKLWEKKPLADEKAGYWKEVSQLLLFPSHFAPFRSLACSLSFAFARAIFPMRWGALSLICFVSLSP